MPSRKTVNLFLGLGCASLFFLSFAFLVSLSHGKENAAFFGRPVVSSSAALQKAKEVIASSVADFDVKALRYQNIEYASANEEILYLLRRYGVRQAKVLIKDARLPFFYWVVTLKDRAHRKVRVGIDSADGAVVSYTFSPSETSPSVAEDFTIQEAENQARGFLEKMGLEVSSLSLEDIQKNTEVPNEYELTWVREGAALEGNRLLLRMSLKNGSVAVFSYGLTLPKRFSHAYARSTFLSASVLGVSMALWFTLGFILLGLAIVKRKSLDYSHAWKGVLFLGPVFLVFFFNEAASYGGGWDAVVKIAGAVFFSLLAFILIAVTIPLFKESFNRGILAWKQKDAIVPSILIGYSLTFGLLLAVLLLYSLLEHFGIIWDVGINEIIGAILTSKSFYLTPFLLAIIPAATEELFRGFWIALFRNVFGRTFIAVGISALIWGLAHTAVNGSSFPGYVSGVEKTLTGMMIGYSLVYFGIETTLIWHFLNNVFATLIFLFILGGSLRVYAGWCALLLCVPFAAALYCYFRNPHAKKSAETVLS